MIPSLRNQPVITRNGCNGWLLWIIKKNTNWLGLEMKREEPMGLKDNLLNHKDLNQETGTVIRNQERNSINRKQAFQKIETSSNNNPGTLESLDIFS